MSQIEAGIAQSAEGTMVDAANLLAEIVETDLGARPDGGLADAFTGYKGRSLEAQIFDVTKSAPSFRVYITDELGRVVFDSAGEAEGADYSRWNDVYLTLRGEYGARTTRLDPDDEDTAVLYVAAPLHRGDAIAGVLTVAKSKDGLTWYRDAIQGALIRTAGLTLAAMLVLAVALAWWFSRSVGMLRRYAAELTGERGDASSTEAPTPPAVTEPELAALAHAMADMRTALDGKAYVEDYVRGLTHELKSPVAAISGAVELLDGNMPAADRARFIANIRHETTRLETITSRMLELAALEHADGVADERVDLGRIVADETAQLEAAAGAKMVRFEIDGSGMTYGDPFLIGQALRNLLDNALRAAPPDSTIGIVVGAGSVVVTDQGPGVPEFAHARLTERFYALPDPVSGKKGTGLGLAFVGQIMALHGGEVLFTNSDEGFSAHLCFSA